MPRSGIAGSYDSSIFSFFKEPPYCSPLWLYQFTFLPRVHVLSCFSCVQLFVTLWAEAHQAPLFMGDSPGKKTGVDCHALLQQIFPTQGLNWRLWHYRQILYHWGTQEATKTAWELPPPPPLTPSPEFIICRLFDDGYSDWCEVMPHCSFDLNFSKNSDVEHLLKILNC